jgi:hypothetical protein
MSDHDPVNSPPHYFSPTGGELVDTIAHLNYLKANAIKYTFRSGQKDPDKEVEDLKKAIWCLNKQLSIIELNKQLSIIKECQHYSN